MNEMNVLKLDSSYKPIEVITWQDAFILTWLKKAYVVEYTEQPKNFKFRLLLR